MREKERRLEDPRSQSVGVGHSIKNLFVPDASSSPFLFTFSFPFLLPSDIGRQSLPVRPMEKRKRKRRKEKKRYRPKGATPSRRGSWLGYERPCDSTFILESHACLSSNQPTLPFGRLSFCLLFFVFFFPVFSIPSFGSVQRE